MKKIALLLALLLCLAPVLSACGANSSAKKAAAAAFEAYYIDGDAEAFFEVNAAYNLDLIKKYISSEKADSLKETARSKQDSAKENIKEQWDKYTDSEDDGGLGAEDLKVKYEILFVDTYGKKSEAFENALESFTFNDTDIEDEVTKIARVGILGTVTFSIDGDDYTDATVRDYTCYCIDGKWYID